MLFIIEVRQTYLSCLACGSWVSCAIPAVQVSSVLHHLQVQGINSGSPEAHPLGACNRSLLQSSYITTHSRPLDRFM